MSLIWNILNAFPDQADQRTVNWFFMNSTWPVVILIYLYVKFSTDWGPKWMKNREPFQIDRLVQIYDAFQVIANAYVCQQFLTHAWLRNYNWRCEPIDYSLNPRALRVAEICHYFYMLKLLDLLDTVFFILRKKQNQVTFLHVYHHASMVGFVWIGVRFFAGGQITSVGVVNAFIHSVMYSHYFVMSLKKWKPWWKKHITQMQILQFLILFYHFGQLWWVEDCGFPKSIAIIFVPQNFLMIWMFSNFYYHAYIKAPKKNKAQ